MNITPITDNEYVGTIVLNGLQVIIGLDDYGQQYICQYEKDGELVEFGCGAYNLWFLEDIVSFIDYEGYKNNKYDFEELYESIGFKRPIMSH